jgi:hypothetical protein
LLKIFAGDVVQYLKPVIVATLEVEIWRIIVQGQPRLRVFRTPSQPLAECGVIYLSSQVLRDDK